MHHRPAFKCGYDQNAVCTGIRLLLPFQELSCSNSNDFFRLPTKFQGVIQSVQFFDFGSNAFGDTNLCLLQFDPLGEGLFDAFGKLGGKGVAPLEKCYMEDPWQRPGILLPLPQLSSFSPAMLQALPTVAVVGVLTNPQIIRTTLGINIVSGCQGFKIAAKYTKGATQITVSNGYFWAYTDQQGAPVPVLVKAAEHGAWRIEKGSDEEIQVWLFAQENVNTHAWTGVVAITWNGGGTWDPQKEKLPQSHVKKRLLGTVSHRQGKVDVLQSQCSPVDLRDGTDTQIKGNYEKYVFIYDTQSGTKKWVPLNECG